MSLLRRLHPARLAGPLDRHPGRLLTAALLVCLLGSIGFKDFAVDSGQGLLVGSRSDTGQAYSRFSRTFGSDPLVVVLRARNAPALYVERNLQRLQALEIDLSQNPDVSSVLGPGTVAAAGKLSASQEVDKVLIEYPFFLAKLDVLLQEQKGQRDANTLNQLFQTDQQKFTQLIGLTFLRAVSDARQARGDAAKQPTAASSRKLDAREQTVEQAVSKDPLPPGFDTYLASSSPNVKVDEAVARTTFDRLVASDGECNDRLAGLLQMSSNCQAFYERLLLDLPNCPLASAKGFCAPKGQWATVLPKPASTDAAYAVITVRMTPAAAADPGRVRALHDKIDRELQRGIDSADLSKVGSAARQQQLRDLGPLAPRECGDQPKSANAGCYSAFNNDRMDYTIAGAPLLALGITGAMTHLLVVLLPFALLLMLLLLVGTFRARGRVWPLPAALAAAALTIGGALWTRTAITPAVLAGVPVLVGLAVDYAVQLVARHSEARREGLPSREAIRVTLATAGPATGVAALATLAGLVALVVIAGIDLGPLSAVPLVAEFALVLAVGIVVSWLAAIFVALPAAVLADRRRPVPEEPALARGTPPVATRTAALATRWRVVLVPAAVLAVAGWVLLPRVPVETSAERLLAPNLAELRDVQDVRQAIGYANEVDVYVEGQVIGPYGGQRANDNVLWQCATAEAARRSHGAEVVQATSIADLFFGTTTTSTGDRPSSRRCLAPSAGGAIGGGRSGAPASPAPPATPSPSSGGPAASPAAAASPSARRLITDTAQLGRSVPLAASAADTPGATPVAPTALASPAAPGGTTPLPTPVSGSPSGGAATATPAPSSGSPPRQGGFLCSLRSFPQIARVLVMDIPDAQKACPPVDLFTGNAITQDSQPNGPIDPQSARIVLGINSTAIADQARLVTSVGRDLQPPNGLRAQPAGLVVLAARAYDTLIQRALFLNLTPLLLVALVLLAVHRSWRRSLLPVLPTALAAGWAPLLLIVLGHVPGTRGTALSQFTPLTVVLGALVVALGTEFGVLVLGRFDEECAAGSSADQAAATVLASTGRAVAVSALTLGGGFAVLALSGFLPGGLPLLSDFGLAVVVDLALAVGAVFGVMLPVAVALERAHPRPARARAGAAANRGAVPSRAAAAAQPVRARSAPPRPAEVLTPATPPAPLGRRQRAARAGRGAAAPPLEDGMVTPPVEPAPAPPVVPGGQPADPVRRLPGMSGRRRVRSDPPSAPTSPEGQGPRRLPGLSGRPRQGPGAGTVPPAAAAAAAPSEQAAAEPPVAEVAPPPAAAVSPNPGSAPVPRRRRRRPPPHVRRRADESPGGEPEDPDTGTPPPQPS